jgi:rhodanese-related sulfurtransferase
MTTSQSVPEVPVSQVPSDGWLLDVREPDEWEAGHAPGAVHIPLGDLGQRSGEVPSDQTIYVICRSGGRSGRATEALNNAGWQAVNVAGGMQRWAAEGRPMVTDTGQIPRVA